MSAQILLSMIAPGLAPAPQGSTGQVAGEFEALLAGLAAGGIRGGDGSAAIPAPPAEDPESPEAAAGLLVPVPTSVAPPPAPVPAPGVPSTETAAPADGSVAAPAPNGAILPVAGETGARTDDSTPAAAAPPAPPPGPTSAAVDAPAAAAPGATPSSAPAPASAEEAARASAVAAASAPPPVSDGEPATAAAPSGVSAPAVAPTPSPPFPPGPAAVAAPAPLPLRAPEGNAASSPGSMSESETSSEGSDAGLADRAASASAPAAGKPTVDAGVAPAYRPEQAAEASPRLQADPATPDEGRASGEGDVGPAPTPDSASAAAREASTPTPLLSRAAVEATAQIAAQILRKLDGRSTRFEMALLPEELGRVDVKLDIDSDGRLAARLAFDNPAAATDLRGRADELRRQLEQAGFHLAEDALEFAERDSGSSAFDRGDDPRHGSGRAFTAAARLHAEADAAPVARWTSLSLTPAGVDLKV